VSCPDINEITAFLEGQLPADEAERIEHHLDACPDCRQMVAFAGDSSPFDRSGPTAIVSDASLAGEPRRAGPLKAGDRLDNFVVVRWLGAGGMGEVYLAKDAELGRRVAIKIIRADRIGASHEVDRFVREARVTARLNHPGIVTIYAIGRTSGTPYLALEYVEGETLHERLVRGALEPKAWVPIAKAVAEAAREAHRHLIVHGDLKPSNVLLGRDGRVRTLDFGLARFVRGELSLESDMTIRSNTGPASNTGIQGTPAYMAPEQWDAQPATPASDVWAMGILTFEMAIGHVPFSIAQVARREADAAAACEAARQSGVELPAVVEDLLVRCLDVQPERRPTMQQVVDALGMLERALELPSLSSGELPWGPPAPKRDESRGERSAPSANTGPAGSSSSSQGSVRRGRAAVLLVSSLLVTGAAVAAWSWPRHAAVDGAPSPSAIAITEPDETLEAPDVGPVRSAEVVADSALARSAEVVVAGTSPPASGRGPVATAPPAASTPTGLAAPTPTKPPLPSMRLAAIASLEDKAEEADRNRNKALARQFRGMADKHLDDVERNAMQMKSVEPGDAATLLDYVRQARAYLRQRRAASGAP
jgi:serine/threonine protein kinase